jgi:hypothetical protein
MHAVDERARLARGNLFETVPHLEEQPGHRPAGQLWAEQYEATNARLLNCVSLRFVEADALVLGDDCPASLPVRYQPLIVRGSLL